VVQLAPFTNQCLIIFCLTTHTFEIEKQTSVNNLSNMLPRNVEEGGSSLEQNVSDIKYRMADKK